MFIVKSICVSYCNISKQYQNLGLFYCQPRPWGDRPCVSGKTRSLSSSERSKMVYIASLRHHYSLLVVFLSRFAAETQKIPSLLD